MDNLTIENVGGQFVVDSRLVAERLKIQHETFLKTIRKYQDKIEQRFGCIAFKTILVKMPNGGVRQDTSHCYLTESQTAFLMTLSRNSNAVIEAKAYIVSEFAKARELAQSSKAVLDFFEELKETCKGNTGGFIYLIQAKTTNCYKIGVSKSPFKRLTNLQIGSPLELVVIDRIFSIEPFKLEAALHSYYSEYWVRGEWFDFPDEVAKSFVESANRVDFDIEQKCLEG